MPYEIKRKGRQHCVVNAETGEEVACHPTRAAALQHQRALVVAMQERGEQMVERAVDLLAEAVRGELEGRGLWGVESFADLEELRKAREARSKRYGIGVKGERSNLTPPKGYPTDEKLYGDPCNLRYPCDPAHALPARQYYNHEGQREKGGYTAAEWAIVGKRIAKLSGEGYVYKDGQVVPKGEEESAASDAEPFAATHKKLAQRLARDLEELLDAKDVPDFVLKEARELRAALRRPWDGMGGEGMAESFVHEAPFALADAEQRIAYGVVVPPDEFDGQGHRTSGEEVEKAAHLFLARLTAGEAGLDEHHARLVNSDQAQVVESWVQREPTTWRFSVGGEVRETEVAPGSWCAGVHFSDDELWQQVLDGEITGFSPRGKAMLTPAEGAG